MTKRQPHRLAGGAKWVCLWWIMLFGGGVSADEVVPPAPQEVKQYQFMLLLNKEYILALNRRRQYHASGSAAARFDVNLMRSAIAFNQKLDAENALYHDKSIRVAELCGSL